MAIMKRFRGDEADDSVACTLMLLSSGTIASPGYTNSTHHTNHNSPSSTTTTTMTTTSSGGGSGGDGGRVFECKTCNRQFSSFQALGGHRASHKRAKLTGDQDGSSVDGAASAALSNPGPKVHECSICGTEFAMGQALGGHMRRHRAQLMGAADHHNPNLILAAADKASASASPSATTKRLYLDLNYPPVDIVEGDFLGMGLVGKVPMVHC